MSRYMLSDQLIRRHRKPRLPLSRRRATHSRYCRALRIEPLEDRMVLSTFAHFIDLSTPASGVFPSNVFTVADTSNLTGLRVNLPLPDSTTNPADFQDIQVINTLDGFNIQPRLSIPFDGPIDVSTVNSESVFLVRMGDTADCRDRRVQVVGINQIVWDPATNTLHVESDELLEQHTRYALVVTDAIRDADGLPVKATKDFRLAPLKLLLSRDPALRNYGRELVEGLVAAWRAGVSPQHIVTASVFTTQSTTAVLEKIRDQIHDATPAPADFSIGLNGEHTVFNQNELTSIVVKQQTTVGAPPVLTNFNPLAQLRILTGKPNVVGQVAYGKYVSPVYEAPGEGYIPAIGTRTGTPEVQGYNDIYFTLYLPAGEPPEGGWPVAIFGHGGTGNKEGAFGVGVVAAKMAENGIATIGINAVGHGLGPGSTLTVTQTGGGTVTLPAGGRGIDQNGDGSIGNTEGQDATAPQAIISSRDARIQTAADHMQLVRVIQAGMDVDGDGAADLDPSRAYYIGASLSALHGTPFLAVEPDVSAGVLYGVGGPGTEIRRLRGAGATGGTDSGRPGTGAELAARVPSLLNAPGISTLGGVTGGLTIPPTSPTSYFNENMPLWDDNPFMPDENDDPLIVNLTDGTTNVVIQSPVTNTVPGAMGIQQLFENQEWVYQSGSAVAYAPYLRKDPLAGVSAKSIIVQFAKGDQTIENPTTTAFLRAGDLADVATYYRHDLADADVPSRPDNPHTFLGLISSPIMRDIAFGVQQQIAAFFASDGSQIIQPPGVPAQYFEVGMDESELPEGLNFVGVAPPPAPVGASAAASIAAADNASPITASARAFDRALAELAEGVPVRGSERYTHAVRADRRIAARQADADLLLLATARSALTVAAADFRLGALLHDNVLDTARESERWDEIGIGGDLVLSPRLLI